MALVGIKPIQTSGTSISNQANQRDASHRLNEGPSAEGPSGLLLREDHLRGGASSRTCGPSSRRRSVGLRGVAVGIHGRLGNDGVLGFPQMFCLFRTSSHAGVTSCELWLPGQNMCRKEKTRGAIHKAPKLLPGMGQNALLLTEP